MGYFGNFFRKIYDKKILDTRYSILINEQLVMRNEKGDEETNYSLLFL